MPEGLSDGDGDDGQQQRGYEREGALGFLYGDGVFPGDEGAGVGLGGVPAEVSERCVSRMDFVLSQVDSERELERGIVGYEDDRRDVERVIGVVGVSGFEADGFAAEFEEDRAAVDGDGVEEEVHGGAGARVRYDAVIQGRMYSITVVLSSAGRRYEERANRDGPA